MLLVRAAEKLLVPLGIKRHPCLAVILFHTHRRWCFFSVLPENKRTQLFVCKWQTILTAIDRFLLFFFSFFPPNKDLYATLGLCPEVKINMTVMYQIQRKINVWLCLCLPQCTRLCVSEINRVRKDMYSDTVNGLVDRHPLELPEPMGPIVHLQEKLFVPVKEYPDVSSCFTHLTWQQLYHSANIIGVFFFIVLRLIFTQEPADKWCFEQKIKKRKCMEYYVFRNMFAYSTKQLCQQL